MDSVLFKESVAELLVPLVGLLILLFRAVIKKSLLSELCPGVGVRQDKRAGEATQPSGYF